MRPRQRTAALLSALVVLALAVSASVASAYTPIPFEWKVKGAALKEGASKEITLSTKGLFHLNLHRYGSEISLTSNKVKLLSGKITGGKPGKISGKLVFEGVTVTRPKEGCVEEEVFSGQRGVIETAPMTGEIVEIPQLEEKAHVGLSLESSYWPEFHIVAANGGKEECSWEPSLTYFNPRGGMVLEVSPQEKEAIVEGLHFSSPSGYRNSKGEGKTAALESPPGLGPTLTGEAEAELVSKELFGAF